MKVRFRILLCLLALVAVWCFWPRAGVVAPRTEQSTPPASATKAAAAKTSVAKVQSKLSTAVTNWLAFRLSNTPKTLKDKDIIGNPNFILLQNAIIDTRAKTDLKIPSHLKASDEPGAYIVQARGVIDPAFRAAIAEVGGTFVSYIPNNAELLQLSSAGAAKLASNPRVQTVLPWEPYYKVSSSLLGLAAEQQPLPAGNALTLGLLPGNAAATRQEVEKLGGKVIGTDQSPFGPVLRVLPPENWTALASVSGVQLVELSHQRVSANDLTRATLGVAADSQVQTNWLNLTGSNVLVAVADTGVDATHPDLASRVFGYTATDLTDTNGHGTHVAGIIAGSGLESLTVSNAEGSIMPATNGQFRGMAPLANLYSINENYSDQFLQQAEALTNALISNNSWGYGGDYDYDLAAASYDAATRDSLVYLTGPQAVLYVFSAGNSGGGGDDGTGGSPDTINSPGTAKNVLTVGALEQPRNITNIVTIITPGEGTNAPVTNQYAYWQAGTDSGSQVAAYSSRGNVGIQTEGDLGRFKPDVVSPGTFVVSTRSSQWDTNAYFNNTNVSTVEYVEQYITPGALNYYNVSVPPNAIAVTINITSNRLSKPFLTNFPIYVKQFVYPTANSYDILTTSNALSIPPDSGGTIAGIQSIQNNGFDFAVGDGSTNASVYYDVSVSIYTTNNVGDLYSVLFGMDNDLGPYYRYETGTSMAAANVSGTLALIQDYFTNTLKQTPSPALLKAMLINGARPTGGYQYGLNGGINFQGWGLPSLPDCLPLTNTTQNLNALTAAGPLFFVEQSPTNALATGDSHTYNFTLDTNNFANYLYLQATLVWSDPPGNPAAAIKLVNNLELVLTNLDTGDVFYGNDISPDNGYNLPSSTNLPPNLDLINNVQNIILPPQLGGRYSLTVIGRAVNVNAVTGQTNSFATNGPSGTYEPNIVQDFSLVVSIGEGEVPTAITSVTDLGTISNPTNSQDVTLVLSTNAPLFNQMAGANSPYLSTNDFVIGGFTNYGFYTNSVFHIGQTNQWHFFVVTNDTPYTNAAFIVFLPNTLSLPREGVNAGSDANSTRPEASLQLLVASVPDVKAAQLTNLDYTVLSNCLANVNGDQSAVGRGGTQFVAYTNSAGNQVYYVGVQCQDQTAAQFAFLPVFSQQPFSTQDKDGNVYVHGLPLPVNITDGNNRHPGIGYVFGLCLQQITVGQVVVTNAFQHQNFGDLIGTLSHSGISDVLNNHDGLGPVNTNQLFIYDDSGTGNVPGATHSDGPGSLKSFRGKQAIGPWTMTQIDDSYTQTGSVTSFEMKIVPHRDFKQPFFIEVTVPPNGWFYDYIDVSAGNTNLTVYGTNVTVPNGFFPVAMIVKEGSEPVLTDTNHEAFLTPSNFVSVGPPLSPDRYFVGLYNSNNLPQTVDLSYTLAFDQSAITVVDYNSTGKVPLVDDAISLDPLTGGLPSLFVTNTDRVQDFQIGLRVDHPRISDLVFHLISPDGTRYLLMENRGGQSTNGCGLTQITTNIVDATANGTALANTNFIDTGATHGSFPITYNFYTAPDQMTVYYGTNVSPGYLIYNTGMTNNVVLGPGPQNTQPVTINVSYPPPGISANSTFITIVMNQYGNTNTQTAWTYEAGGVITNFVYLTFTEDTNLTTTPIQFAPPPFYPHAFTNITTNIVVTTSNLCYLPEQDVSGINGTDPYGLWQLEILDNRAGATNNANLLGWQMQFTYANTNILILPVMPTNNATYSIIESNLLTVTNTVLNASNFPSLSYAWSETSGTVTNANISANGIFTWTPTEAQGPGTYIFVVTATDPADPRASAEDSFTVNVLESNLPPVITFPTNNAVLSIWENATFLTNATAYDPDIPTNTLTFGLAGIQNVNGPGIPTNGVNGFAIGPDGTMFWQPAETNGPSTNIVYITCTDTNPPAVNQKSFTVTNAFTLVVLESNQAPVLPSLPDLIINEQTLMTVADTATDADWPSNSLTYQVFITINTNAMLANGWPLTYATTLPAPSIDGNGVITWTPSEAQGPGVYTITTIVTDFNPWAVNNQHLSATNSFNVTVEEVNQGPVILSAQSVTNYELNLMTIPVQATNYDLPPGTMSYALAITVDTNATIAKGWSNSLAYATTNPPPAIDTNGVITWTPGEAQGPAVYDVTVYVTETDVYAPVNPTITVSTNLTITVLETNSAPFWTNGYPNVAMTVQQVTNVSGFATDTDLPPNTLTYTLSNAPVWVTINPTSGVVTLAPGLANGPSTNTIYVVVTDNGVPPLSAETNFTVIVGLNTTIVTFGNPDDFRGVGVKYWNGSTYICGDSALNGGFLADVPLPLFTGETPAWATNWPFGDNRDQLNGITASANGLYSVGQFYNLTSDPFGRNEQKGLTVKYPFAGPVGGGTGGDIWNVQTPASPGAFGYGGYEGLNAVTLTNESGVNYVYATGNGQSSGANGGRLFISKLDESGNVLWTKTDGAEQIGVQYSAGEALTVLNTNIYVAGVLNTRPYLRKYDPSGNLLWTTNNNSVSGEYYGAASALNYIYAVGYANVSGTNTDFLIDKWDESGNLIWSRTYDRATAQDQLNAAVNFNNRIFAVGYTYGQTSGGADAIVVEIDPLTGNLLSTNLFGGALDDKANGVDTDNTNLYVIGESRSFDNGTNQVMLFVYTPGIQTLSPGSPDNNVVAPGGISWFEVNVPTNAIAASNALIFATSPVNFYFSSNAPPSTNNLPGGDYEFAALTIGTTNVIYTNNTPPTPLLIPGETYYLGVQNPNAIAVTNAVEVTFALAPPDLDLTGPTTNTLGSNSIAWYRVKVPVNADISTNSILFATPAGVNLWYSTNVPPGIAGPTDNEMLTGTTGGAYEMYTTNAPYLVPGSFYYLGVQNANAFSVTYAVKVTFHLVVPTYYIYSIVPTNSAGTNGFIITWYAPTNTQFHLQWTPSLLPTTWKEMKGVISFDSYVTATNSHFSFFDTGDTNWNSAPFGPMRFYRLHLLNSPTNTAPVFYAQPPDVFTVPQTLLTVTNAARDFDIPPQNLTYALYNSLGYTNALINGNGVITWPTSTNSVTNVFTTVVTDNGVPVKHSTNSFVVIVSGLPSMTAAIVTNGVSLTWTGSTNQQFQINWTTNLVPPVVWTPFPPPPVTSTNGLFKFVDTNAPFPVMKFYELILLP